MDGSTLDTLDLSGLEPDDRDRAIALALMEKESRKELQQIQQEMADLKLAMEIHKKDLDEEKEKRRREELQRIVEDARARKRKAQEEELLKQNRLDRDYIMAKQLQHYYDNSPMVGRTQHRTKPNKPKRQQSYPSQYPSSRYGFLQRKGPARKHAREIHTKYCDCVKGRLDKHGKLDEDHNVMIHSRFCNCHLYGNSPQHSVLIMETDP